jgi:pyridoxine 5-phosphate synthase
MTKLSVNINKVALIRNSRGEHLPDLVQIAKDCESFGAQGITVHPRPDERHIRYDDIPKLKEVVQTEFNIEGNPSPRFMDLVIRNKPHQCTLVPDDVNQLTSDHGWNIGNSMDVLGPVLKQLATAGVRSCLFVDPDPEQPGQASAAGANRIELYTEEYASHFMLSDKDQVLERYRKTAAAAREAGIGVNAGHDLDLVNLADFLTIGNILEVSIGHALTIESLERGVKPVVAEYLEICHA